MDRPLLCSGCSPTSRFGGPILRSSTRSTGRPRSPTDFAKIVAILDAREASSVLVTQQFNTTNSMGRLTPNVLLSFAQYIRTGDPDHHLVQMPSIARPSTTLVQPSRNRGTEFQHPTPPALGEQLFRVAVAQRVLEIEPDRMLNALRRKAMATVPSRAVLRAYPTSLV
jgi:hypothetical protein